MESLNPLRQQGGWPPMASQQQHHVPPFVTPPVAEPPRGQQPNNWPPQGYPRHGVDQCQPWPPGPQRGQGRCEDLVGLQAQALKAYTQSLGLYNRYVCTVLGKLQQMQQQPKIQQPRQYAGWGLDPLTCKPRYMIIDMNTCDQIPPVVIDTWQALKKTEDCQTVDAECEKQVVKRPLLPACSTAVWGKTAADLPEGMTCDVAVQFDTGDEMVVAEVNKAGCPTKFIHVRPDGSVEMTADGKPIYYTAQYEDDTLVDFKRDPNAPPGEKLPGLGGKPPRIYPTTNDIDIEEHPEECRYEFDMPADQKESRLNVTGGQNQIYEVTLPEADDAEHDTTLRFISDEDDPASSNTIVIGSGDDDGSTFPNNDNLIVISQPELSPASMITLGNGNNHIYLATEYDDDSPLRPDEDSALWISAGANTTIHLQGKKSDWDVQPIDGNLDYWLWVNKDTNEMYGIPASLTAANGKVSFDFDADDGNTVEPTGTSFPMVDPATVDATPAEPEPVTTSAATPAAASTTTAATVSSSDLKGLLASGTVSAAATAPVASNAATSAAAPATAGPAPASGGLPLFFTPISSMS